MFGPNPHDKPPDSPIGKNQLRIVPAPDDLWSAIESKLDQPKPVVYPVWRWQWAAAAAAVVVAVGSWAFFKSRAGWVETGADTRTQIQVGDIGVVNMEPNTRLRIVSEKPEEHRILLARGKISARVTAPPRLFFVETPSATAVDLGCAYTLLTDESGNGTLEVTIGQVSLEKKGRESLVPAGASCRMRSKLGPGTPYFNDAPEELRNALDSFDTNRTQLDSILGTARKRDTLTLIHLLPQVENPDRERVFNRMTALMPLPEGVTRDLVLKLDPATLTHWRDLLVWSW